MHLRSYAGSEPHLSNSSELRDTEGHAIYEPTESSTSKKTESTWLNIFGDSQRGGGDVYIDTVTVGDIVIPDQGDPMESTRWYILIVHDSDSTCNKTE